MKLGIRIGTKTSAISNTRRSSQLGHWKPKNKNKKKKKKKSLATLPLFLFLFLFDISFVIWFLNNHSSRSFFLFIVKKFSFHQKLLQQQQNIRREHQFHRQSGRWFFLVVKKILIWFVMFVIIVSIYILNKGYREFEVEKESGDIITESESDGSSGGVGKKGLRLGVRLFGGAGLLAEYSEGSGDGIVSFRGGRWLPRRRGQRPPLCSGGSRCGRGCCSARVGRGG